MRKAVRDKASMLNDNTVIDQLMEDVDVLQLSVSDQLFDAATALFQKKWDKCINPNMKAFLDYFKVEWRNKTVAGLKVSTQTVRVQTTAWNQSTGH